VGAARPVELETREMLEVARQLVDMGTRKVTLIGGEAYLRPNAPEVVRLLSGRGVRVTMQTGGLAFTPARAQRAAIPTGRAVRRASSRSASRATARSRAALPCRPRPTSAAACAT